MVANGLGCQILLLLILTNGFRASIALGRLQLIARKPTFLGWGMSVETRQVPAANAEIPVSPGSPNSPLPPVVAIEADNGTADGGVTAKATLDMVGPQKEATGQADEPAPDQPSSGDILALVATIEQRILLVFEQKLAFDASKEKQIDRLHEELQGYRSDLVAKAVRPVFQSMIRLHDDFGKVLEALEREDPLQITPERMLGILKGFRDDVEMALSHNGVQAYRTDTDVFDPRRQKVLRKVETAEPTQVGQLAARMRPGFEYGENILEKERVAVYAMAQAGPSDSKDKGV
jgi:molecular chaperone GrpE